MVTSHRFTNPIDADVISVWGTRRPIFHLARHGKEKLKVLRLAVEFTSIFLFNFCVGFPTVQPSAEGLVVILCTLLGTEIQAILRTRVNVAQLVDAARSWTVLATILRLGVTTVSLLELDSSAASSRTF